MSTLVGLLLLTCLPSGPFRFYLPRVGLPGAPGVAIMPMMKVRPLIASATVAQSGVVGGSAPMVSVRKEFPETWLWQSIAPTRYLS